MAIYGYRRLKMVNLLEIISNDDDMKMVPFMEDYHVAFISERVREYEQLCWKAIDHKMDPIGFVLGELVEKEGVQVGQIICLNVRKDYVATVLPEHLLRVMNCILGLKGAYFTEMLIRKDVEGGTAFCQNIGFIAIRKVREYFIDFSDALVMRWVIPQAKEQFVALLKEKKRKREALEEPEDLTHQPKRLPDLH